MATCIVDICREGNIKACAVATTVLLLVTRGLGYDVPKIAPQDDEEIICDTLAKTLVYTKEKVEAKRVVGGDGFVKWLMDNLPEETRLADMIRIASVMESLARRSEEAGGLGILLEQVVTEAKAKKAAELDEDKLVKEHMDKCSDHEHIRTKENFGTEEFEVDICLELVRKALDGDIDSLQTFASPAALVALLRCFYTVHANKGQTRH